MAFGPAVVDHDRRSAVLQDQPVSVHMGQRVRISGNQHVEPLGQTDIPGPKRTAPDDRLAQRQSGDQK